MSVKFPKIIFPSFNQQPAIGKHRRRESFGGVSRWETGQLRPCSIEVATFVIGREPPPIAIVVALGHHRSVGQLKSQLGAVRGLMNEGLNSLGLRNAGEYEQTVRIPKTEIFCKMVTFPEGYREPDSAWGEHRQGRNVSKNSLSKQKDFSESYCRR